MAKDVKIRIKSANMFQRGINAAQRSLRRLGAVARAVGRGIKVAFSMAAVAVAGLAVATASAVKAYAKQQEAEEGLAAALRNSGDEIDKNLSKFKAYAAELQKVTRYGDEAILESMAYARNLGVEADQLEQATKAAIGLAATYRLDLQTAMMLVGRASQGQTQMLTRYGIVLDDTLAPQEKFNALLQIGASRFSLAEDAAKTTAGRLDQLSNAYGDLKEKMGEVAVENLGLIDKIGRLIQTIEQLRESGKIDEWAAKAKQAFESMLPGVKNLAAELTTMAHKLQEVAAFWGGYQGIASPQIEEMNKQTTQKFRWWESLPGFNIMGAHQRMKPFSRLKAVTQGLQAGGEEMRQVYSARGGSGPVDVRLVNVDDLRADK